MAELVWCGAYKIYACVCVCVSVSSFDGNESVLTLLNGWYMNAIQ